MSVSNDAHQAQNLLEDEFLQRIFFEIKEELKKKIMESEEDELRDAVYYEHVGIASVERKLRIALDKGILLQKGLLKGE
jgi:hypothetical protein|tara:strand:+ start:626 stop:862 length:237 start_codon:yes stop_codon:yes gene_type:complete